jgi:hypothetical protein
MSLFNKELLISMYFVVTCLMLVPSFAFSATNESLSSTLLYISKETNKNLPVRLDNEITLETTYVSGDTLVWKYRFAKESALNNPNFKPSLYKYHAEKSQKEIACKDSYSMDILRKGGSFYYYFTDIYGKTILDFTINLKSCRN